MLYLSIFLEEKNYLSYTYRLFHEKTTITFIIIIEYMTEINLRP